MESSMLEMLKEGTRKRVEERLSSDTNEKSERIQHNVSLEDEVIEMKNEIVELKTAIKGLVEMMTAVYDFEDEST